ncbi:MAG: peptidoglycan DD-metalloendopeptidase family protein [bacterium]|nr:peptidoglycan DD-metalloendopeptidase family protein [bacterium]
MMKARMTAIVSLLLVGSMIAPAAAGDQTDDTDTVPDVYPMVFPVGGSHSFTDTFGAPRSEGRKHQGADVFTDKLTPVLAVADGTVRRVATGDRSGRYIVIEHDDGWRSYYLHLNNDSPGTDDGLADDWIVEAGTEVEAGDVIDFVGDSGNAESTPSHLHFELHTPDGLAVNPTPHLLAATGVPLDEIAVTPSPTSAAPSPETRNTELVGHVDPGGGFAAGLAIHSDIVYMGTWGRPDACPASGVRLIDAADPAAPEVIGSIASGEEFPGTDTDSVWVGEIETDTYTGDLAVVAVSLCDNGERERRRDAFRGLAIYDVTDPLQPELLSTIESGTGTQGIHDVDVAARTDGQVLAAATVMQSAIHSEGAAGDVRLVDLSDPSRPFAVGTWDFRTDGDADEVAALLEQGPEEELHSHSVAFAAGGRRLWVGNWDAGATLLAVDDPGRPRIVDRVAEVASGEGNLHTVVSDAQRGVVVVTSEDLYPTDRGIHTAGWGHQVVLDLSGDPIGSFYGPAGNPDDEDIPMDGFFSAHDFEIQDGLVFTSWYSGGVRIVDLADPTDPSEVGYFVPPARSDPQGYWTAPDGGLSFPMVWDVLVEGDRLYISDMNSGLWIARFTGNDPTPFAGA